MTYEFEDEHHDRVAIAPYYEDSIYIDAKPNGIAIGQPSLELALSSDDGTQLRTPRMNMQTVRALRLALHRAERWMEKQS